MKPAQIRIESSHNSEGVKLVIEDHVSGAPIVQFTLNPEQLYRTLLGYNTMDSLAAEVIDYPQSRLIGRHPTIYRRRFQCEVREDIQTFRSGNMPPEWAVWASIQKSDLEAESCEWNLHNSYISVLFRRYDATVLTDEQHAEIQAALDAADSPPRLKPYERRV